MKVWPRLSPVSHIREWASLLFEKYETKVIMLIRFFLYSIYRKAVVPCRSEHIYTCLLYTSRCV